MEVSQKKAPNGFQADYYDAGVIRTVGVPEYNQLIQSGSAG